MHWLLDKLYHTVAVACLPGGCRMLIGGRPRSLASFRILSSLQEEPVAFRTIIDCGANVGQFARAASSAYPEATIISFEPLPDIAREYRANLADVPRARIVNSALGSHDGEVTLARHRNSQESAVVDTTALPPTNAAAGEIVELVKVPMVCLDTYFAGQQLETPLLIKMDLQGHELAAIQGGLQILGSASHLVLEVLFDRTDPTMIPFEQLIATLQQLGFRLVRPLATACYHGPSISQMDVLFARLSD